MKISVLGTGMVGRALAARLAGLGHDVVIGTRDVAQTLARTESSDARGTPPYTEWQRDNPAVRLVPLTAAGAHGEIVVNAIDGALSLSALDEVGAANLAGKVLLDLALPLDRSAGTPHLLFANTDSLGEQIQRAFPAAHVVKTLNTVHVQVMIEPGRVPGQHNIFVAGEDTGAKATVRSLLAEFGWPDDAVIDLGGISAARAAEMYAPLYFTLARVLGTYDFNIAIVRGS
jgi:predicted dinucleotide-binding enzyme